MTRRENQHQPAYLPWSAIADIAVRVLLSIIFLTPLALYPAGGMWYMTSKLSLCNLMKKWLILIIIKQSKADGLKLVFKEVSGSDHSRRNNTT